MKAAMDFKEWLKPRVLISGGSGLLLAFLIGWLSIAKTVASVPCRPSGILWIDLNSISEIFSVPVCAGQVVGWRGTKQFTVKFQDTSCVNQVNYTLNQSCPGPPTSLKCSATTAIKQPGSTVSSELGSCDYDVGGGTKDPRVIVIGK